MELHDLNGLKFVAREKYIVSIFPIECRTTRHYSHKIIGGITQFVLPAAQKGTYTKLRVVDSFQREIDNNKMDTLGVLKFSPIIVPAHDIANDLYNEWVAQRLGCNSGLRPGIRVIETEEPSKKLLAELEGQQSAYFQNLINDASGFAASHRFTQITDLHRVAAKWMGYDADWVADLGSRRGNKECVACFEKIPARARICRVCRTEQPEVQEEGSVTLAVPAKPVVTPSMPIVKQQPQAS